MTVMNAFQTALVYALIRKTRVGYATETIQLTQLAQVTMNAFLMCAAV